MPLSRSANSPWYRTALFMAFVAMYLLFAGPLLSQLQASPSHVGHHQTANQHTIDASFCGTHPSDHTSSQPIFNWHHQCEYCAVWQHFPTTHVSLPSIGQLAFIAHSLLPSIPAEGLFLRQHYPDALTRAPPLLMTA
ncbi:unnamed protein product [Ectocarpus sp. 12 AP-2014]